jgi:imidazolonepropionase
MAAAQRRGRQGSRESVDLLIVNAGELVTLAGENQKPRTGKQMRELGIVRDGCLAVKDGRIVAVGKTPEVTKLFRAENIVSANGKTVLPGRRDSEDGQRNAESKYR